MNTPSSEPRDYADEATVQDELLDRKLADIRRDLDVGAITVEQAADAKVEALEHHLAAIKALRAEYFGEEGSAR